MAFEFDPDKSAENFRKHGSAFSEVEPEFYDDHTEAKTYDENRLRLQQR